LFFSHHHAAHIPQNKDQHGKDEPETKTGPEGFGEKFLVAVFQKVISADAHDEKRSQHKGCAEHVYDRINGELLSNHCKEIDHFRPSVSDGITDRALHPGIGNENPDG